MKKLSPSMDAWLREAKTLPSASKIGMYLTHNGVVRSTSKDTVRHGNADARQVTGMVFSYDAEKVAAAIADTYKLEGIYYIKVWLNEGTLDVGDDLMYILNQVIISQSDKSFRTAALFYRDEGDDYLTRHENFSNDPSSTLKFIKKQEAQGGGDYPEAVHTALENAMQNLSWEEGNHARLAFLILDAPPHHSQKILDSLHNSIRLYAAKGIKIIPVAASGIDKSTEFLLRLMAMMTDGTYVFITNDSGVGNDHITPTVGGYQVEQLNQLLVRLIDKYSE